MIIRSASYKDVDQILNLMCELGYPSKQDVIMKNIAEYKSLEGYEVLVAEEQDEILGCISLYVMKLFHTAGYAGRITSLVVSSEKRGKGTGKALVNAADHYFQSKGCIKAEITSGDQRKEAHLLYQSEGFVVDERRFIKAY